MPKLKRPLGQVAILTLLGRVGADFEILADPHVDGDYFHDKLYLDGAAAEMKALRRQMYVLYIATFALSFVVIAGGFPSDAKVSVAGVEVPLTFFSQQAIAAVNAGLYSTYTICLVNMTVLHVLIKAILKGRGGQPWEAYVAHRDAAMLFSALLTPRINQRWSSPRREFALVALVSLASILTVLLHGAVVLASAIIALNKAFAAGGALSQILATFSCATVTICLVSFFASFMLPLPYREDPSKPLPTSP